MIWVVAVCNKFVSRCKIAPQWRRNRCWVPSMKRVFWESITIRSNFSGRGSRWGVMNCKLWMRLSMQTKKLKTRKSQIRSTWFQSSWRRIIRFTSTTGPSSTLLSKGLSGWQTQVYATLKLTPVQARDISVSWQLFSPKSTWINVLLLLYQIKYFFSNTGVF